LSLIENLRNPFVHGVLVERSICISLFPSAPVAATLTDRMGAGGSKDSRSGSAIHQEQSIPITVQVVAVW
jgi:hypothetical protein